MTSKETYSSQDIVVFLGPTFSVEEARLHLEARYLPPASQGDIYSVAREHPWLIGIVDGYFEGVLSVWHQEILWALSEGAHVVGASSLGALRAAELHQFGMAGFGRIFEQFRQEELEDDDEVAVIHGPSSSGFRQLSTAMVDIRATLMKAAQDNVISPRAEQDLISIGKSIFYAQRSYPRLLEEAARVPELVACGERLKKWLPENKVEQKRDDAVTMLRAIQKMANDRAPRDPVRFSFNRTFFWEAFCLDGEHSRTIRPADDEDRRIPDGDLAEHQLGGHDVSLTRERAVSRALALKLAHLLQLRADASACSEAAALIHRSQARSHDEVSLDRWAEEQYVSASQLPKFLEKVALEHRVRQLCEPLVEGQIRDLLRLEGRYGEQVLRSLDKQRILKDAALSHPSILDTGLSVEELWRWYFEGILKRDVPCDLESYCQDCGFEALDEFRSVVVREFLYRRERQGSLSRGGANSHGRISEECVDPEALR